jgi:hypothetical protein
MQQLLNLSGWPPQGGAGPFDTRKAAFAKSPESVTFRKVDRIVGTRIDMTCMFGKEVVTFDSSRQTEEWLRILPKFSGAIPVKACATWVCCTFPTAKNRDQLSVFPIQHRTIPQIMDGRELRLGAAASGPRSLSTIPRGCIRPAIFRL